MTSDERLQHQAWLEQAAHRCADRHPSIDIHHAYRAQAALADAELIICESAWHLANHGMITSDWYERIVLPPLHELEPTDLR